MTKITALIFDLGNVLIDWNPAYLYDKMFEDREKQAYFLKHVANMEWHSLQDAGRSVEEGTEALVQQHPGWEAPIRAFYARWREMFNGPIEGAVQVLQELKERGFRLYALSNWNEVLYRETAADFPFLQWFDGVVLSSEEKLAKPDPEIYLRLLQRYRLEPGEALFIDDRADNVEAAEKLGIRAVRFENPEGLRRHLEALNIL